MQDPLAQAKVSDNTELNGPASLTGEALKHGIANRHGNPPIGHDEFSHTVIRLKRNHLAVDRAERRGSKTVSLFYKTRGLLVNVDK